MSLACHYLQPCMALTSQAMRGPRALGWALLHCRCLVHPHACCQRLTVCMGARWHAACWSLLLHGPCQDAHAGRAEDGPASQRPCSSRPRAMAGNGWEAGRSSMTRRRSSPSCSLLAYLLVVRCCKNCNSNTQPIDGLGQRVSLFKLKRNSRRL